jgi:hypothetical protein
VDPEVGRLDPTDGRETEPPEEGRAPDVPGPELELLLPRAEVRLWLEDPLSMTRATAPSPRAIRSRRLRLDPLEAEDPLPEPPISAPIR